jgi:CrcB protein
MKGQGGLPAAIATLDPRGTVDKSRARAQGNLMIWTLLQVAFGGAIGSILRFATVTAIGAPLATFLVNVAGSFAMGGLFVLLAGRTQLSPLLMTGILGGFTTFSAFSLDALKLWQSGQTLQALLYVLASVILSILAVALGAALARGAFA